MLVLWKKNRIWEIMKNLKYYGFLAMNRHKSQQEWTSSTSAKSGGAVLAAELPKLECTLLPEHCSWGLTAARDRGKALGG